MVKKTKTIARFKIAAWVEKEFVSGSVEISYMSDNSATITDAMAQSMEVTYDEKEGI
ncbi:Uncharacterised protein [uncultured Eubacterium sp.]|nr:Uncharacterised protein [uncultured Eubacterium sp.]